MKRHILSQGDLDGACFLYSVVNTYITLTTREPASQGWDKRFYDRWDRATRFIPYLSDFFQCGSKNEHSGTGRYNDDSRLFAYTTERMLEQMCTEVEKGRFAVAIRDDVKKPASLSSLVHETSVAIVCPNYEHWVVAVHFDSDSCFVSVACSSKYHSFGEYQETYHDYSRAYSNDKLPKGCEFPFAIHVSYDAPNE